MQTPSTDNADDSAPAFSEEEIALAFAEQYADCLRYVPLLKRWFLYDGKRWARDTKLTVFSLVRKLCREYALACNDVDKVGRALASNRTVAAVEHLSQSDPRLSVTPDIWDVEAFWLNTPDGIVNLQTGAKYNHFHQYHLTKITAVGPGGGCPRWHSFLDQITGGDIGLQKYLARVFGYAATASTKEHALFFFFGAGANGKSVLLNTVANILGDYAKTAPIETFTASSFDRHPTELAGLCGARLVSASETEEGRQWAEARIKTLTGGDKISARFMHKDFFEFAPKFKLIIAGNHKPILRSVDEAIRRRFNLVFFGQTIPTADRDPDLAEKLKAEWPGILRWIISGAQEWNDIGLAPPETVVKATAAYLDEQDNLAAWVLESCQTGPEYRDTAKDLLASWTVWARAAGLPAGTRSSFLDGLRKRGLEERRTNLGSTIFGIRVTPQMIGE